jgi:LemA protein
MSKTKRISKIIKDTYSQRYDLPGQRMVYAPVGTYRDGSMRDRLAGFRPLFDFMKSNRFILFMTVFTVFHALLGVYYYNLLVDTQQNMYASLGNVSALLQRRNDIAENLSKAVHDYSKHEQGVFTAIVSLRTMMKEKGVDRADLEKLAQLQKSGKMGPTDPAALGETAAVPGSAAKPGSNDFLSSLSGMTAIAEQYPDLKLSTNFESLMAALVEVEKDLAAERIKFNDTANIYTTNVAKFPCNLFALAFGFERLDYFTANKAAQEFKVINF